jgi:hypothetical protein
VEHDYKPLMERLESLSSCTLLTTGRTGSDFLQSLLDSHPEVLTFNGRLAFHDFWKRSVCVSTGSFAAQDLLDEFIGTHIEAFKSRYDLQERKNQLGDQSNQTIDVDLDTFRSHALGLLDGVEVDSRTALLAVCGAYALCLGQDLEQKTLFFHHAHHFRELPGYLKDFPDSKIISMTRDPRANFVSGIEHHRNSNDWQDTDTGRHLFFYINRILNDATPVERYGKDYRVVRIEDLGREEILNALAEWLGIGYDQCMKRSTWAGLSWRGDKLSKMNTEPGFSKNMLENRWESRLSFTDKYVLNYIMNPRLRRYGYSYGRAGLWGAAIVPFLILLPLSYEYRFLSPRYVLDRVQRGQLSIVLRNGQSYLRRIKVFLKYYFRTTMRREFQQPVLAVDPVMNTTASMGKR